MDLVHYVQRNEAKVWPWKKSQKTFFQNVDENSSATHKVFLRALERCSTIQMTASFVIVA